MRFCNRRDAAERLALRLQAYASEHPLVLAIPRGAVPMARILAHRLGGDLDVVLVHKLRAPGQPELAIGAIDEWGHLYLADYLTEDLVPEPYLAQERRRQLDALSARRRLYSPVHPPVGVAGRTVILVDDGIATGSTMLAAIRSVRLRHAAKVIVATAVAPAAVVERLEDEADDVIALHTPVSFSAIGEFYDDFSAVSDEDVIVALESYAKHARVFVPA